MYLPRNATIEESCEWMEAKTGERWTLPRLLEEAHLTPHVWIDHIPGYPQIFGERLEGYLTKMIFHGDVMRLAADRADALITMFPAHDGSLIKVSPGWRVALKDVRFNGQALERAAEILNGAKPAPEQASPEPVAPSASDKPGSRKQWTPEKLADLKAYRATHTMPETAAKFGITEQRIRQLLPSAKPKASPFSGLTHRPK